MYGKRLRSVECAPAAHQRHWGLSILMFLDGLRDAGYDCLYMQLHLPRVQHALIVAGISLALTAAYHLLIAERLYGFPFVIFTVMFIGGVALTIHLRRQKINAWAFVFLPPAAICMVAEILYASNVVRTLGFIITAVSLALFFYWLSMPQTKLRDVWQFGTTQLIADSILPFQALSPFFSSVSLGKRAKHILTGIIFAIPLLFMIGLLFTSADPLFGSVVRDLFCDWNSVSFIGKLVRDIVVLLFVIAFIWRIYERTKDDRGIPKPTRFDIGSTILPTVLFLLNALFAVFIAFQISFFFGNQELVQRYGLTYADYARNGFFQLLVVAGIVFAFTMLVFYSARLHERAEKILTIILILQTYVVIISAAKRLMLYIDTYGLTLSRWWAMASIVIIALVLTAIAAAALTRMSYFQFVKFLVVFSLFAFSIPLLFNAERQIAENNVQRFLSGTTSKLDVAYLFTLSSDALPPMIELIKRDWPSKIPTTHESIEQALSDRTRRLHKRLSDWRNVVFSDYAAYTTLVEYFRKQ